MDMVETLNYISRQINIYLGIIMFVLGLIGCLWNILIFRHHSLRLSSCCVYMSFGSVASLIQIIFGLLMRILTDGFEIDWTITNIGWCKIRSYITQCASLTALSCFVWATIDRFLSTCRQIKWRYFNSVSIAKIVCLLTMIIWMLTAIPTLIFTKPIQTRQLCGSSSFIYSKILTYCFNLFCYGTFPWLFMSIFGILTLKNLHHTHTQRINPLRSTMLTRMARINNQLTSMLFLQIIISIISSIPYCVQNIYENITQTMIKTEYRRAQENLFLQIVRLAFYFNYISMFYVNYLSSPIFRRLPKKVLINLFKNKNDISNEIAIINHQSSGTIIQRNKLKMLTVQTPYTISHV
ncbi:unnamed protein product [Rotaria sp. Silwood2]|nr:unnamed protein product [Rotaria sp. Silwood2]CAF2577229.1 unnamed protein product [Rotaria sp. Silwood2]CAF2832838.1 unnamed protein product [Rotaria sp. Silwood2]CAF2976940.1 unnamed protein product [Rotaria sp. Silwood2]CAF3862473.1 unnamed protein product [Rotaria sp. Silwood2]